jgi:hypothetical protein
MGNRPTSTSTVGGKISYPIQESEKPVEVVPQDTTKFQTPDGKWSEVSTHPLRPPTMRMAVMDQQQGKLAIARASAPPLLVSSGIGTVSGGQPNAIHACATPGRVGYGLQSGGRLIQHHGGGWQMWDLSSSNVDPPLIRSGRVDIGMVNKGMGLPVITLSAPLDDGSILCCAVGRSLMSFTLDNGEMVQKLDLAATVVKMAPLPRRRMLLQLMGVDR